MRDIIERLEFGCPYKQGTIGEKDAELAEVLMQEAANEIKKLRRTIFSQNADLTILRVEHARLTASNNDSVFGETKKDMPVQRPLSQTRCIHCGKERGNHLANTLNCPVGKHTRAGYISFHNTQTFEPDPTYVPKQKFTI